MPGKFGERCLCKFKGELGVFTAVAVARVQERASLSRHQIPIMVVVL